MTDKKRRGKAKVQGIQIVSFAVLFLGLIVMILPFLWMVLTAFKTYAETVQIPIVWFPKTWTLENFEYVLTTMNFLLYYKNSVIMVVGVIAGQLFVCSLAGYAFARIDFKFRSQLFLFLMAVLMVPGQMTIIARYLLIYNLHLSDTYTGLILPLVPSIFGTFLLRQFFMGIPAELEEADEQKQVEGGDEDDQAAVESEIKWHDTTPFWANARNFFYPIIF